MASNFRNLSGGERSPRRAGAHRRPLVEMEPRKAVLRKLQIKSVIREMTGVRVRVKTRASTASGAWEDFSLKWRESSQALINFFQ
jgi:hypothetical protein